MTKKKTATQKNWCNCKDLQKYADSVLDDKILSSKEIKQQYQIIKNEFLKGKIEVNLEMYEKYLAIGNLFFDTIFPFQKAMTAVTLCTFYKGTNKPRWNKVLIVMGRGNGKDGNIAWWSACLTSKYHKPCVLHYDVDIIANSLSQSMRPIDDILDMAERKNKKKFYTRNGEFGCLSTMTSSAITARSSDARVQDGLRSGAVVFNEVHAYEDYRRVNVMKTGLGKIEDPRTFYFTTNGEVRGGVMDDMLDRAKDVLEGTTKDRGNLFFIYKLDEKSEVLDTKNWIKANPSLPYRETLKEEMLDEFEDWKRDPESLPAFLQKRMNLPEMPKDAEVVPWDFVLKTNQKYDYTRLNGKNCILGLDLSRTTDWTGANLLFYDEELDKYICINHAFVVENNRDLSGIKAPYMDWVNEGYLSLVPFNDVDPLIPLDWAFNLAEDNNYNIQSIVIDDFRKSVFMNAVEQYGYSKDNGNLFLIRPSNIAQTLPLIERGFLNERFIWGNNPMLRWATNNTKVVPWKRGTTDADMGNQLYGKINPRYRKTDPFMAFVHSMCRADDLSGETTIDLLHRGF